MAVCQISADYPDRGTCWNFPDTEESVKLLSFLGYSPEFILPVYRAGLAPPYRYMAHYAV